MKPRILLTHSYFYRLDTKQWKNHKPYPPLGTLYAASVLRNEGFEVSLFDACLANNTHELIPALEQFKPDILVIYDDGFNYLTKMCLTIMRDAAFRMIKMGKEKGLTVIVSSSDSSDHVEEYLQRGADYIILGEGEETLKGLLTTLPSPVGEGLGVGQGVAGVAWRGEDGVVRNEKRKIIDDLDSIPFPAWDLVDMRKYRDIWMKHHGYFSLNMATTRGCPYHCNWCAKPIYGQVYHSRSPENVAGEIELLVKDYGVQHIWFCDDIFGLKPGWVMRFAELAQARGLKFRYTIQSRADLIIKDDYAKHIAQSGAEMVWLGAESGSQKLLDAMDKGQTVEQICQARQMLKENHIQAAFFLQFGYPGEEWQDIQMTINMLLEQMPEDLGISISYPLPGTKFHEKVKEELKQKANWTDSDDLALMYQGTFSPEFYRLLHRHVHHFFRRRQRIQKLKNAILLKSNFNLRLFRDILALMYYIPVIAFERHKLLKQK